MREAIVVERRSVEYVPYLGDFSIAGFAAREKDVDCLLASVWLSMMSRCYREENWNYATYGDIGVFVHRDWHDIRNFMHSVKTIPGWRNKLRNWDQYCLDKDYYGAGCYGPETAVWITYADNVTYRDYTYPICVTDTYGVKTLYVSVTHTREALGIATRTMCRFLDVGVLGRLNGDNARFVGWSFERVTTNELIRYSLEGCNV